MGVKIFIGADIVPTKSNENYFEKGDVNFLLGEDLKSLLAEADFIAMNLEVPLTDTEKPISKCGPNLIAGTKTIKGIHAINPYFFTLANNHILDQDEQGLYSTMSILYKSGIDYAGAGKNLKEASKPYVKNINGIKIGIYCCAEHEFTIASETSAGANPFDPLESPDHVADLKKKCDYVIVLYHGGKEYYRYPSPELQKRFRKLADKGADLIIAQHTHCIGCFEEYNRSTLVYGQGNFLFDDGENEYLKTSLLIQLDLKKSNGCLTSEIRYVPLCKSYNTVKIAAGNNADDILSSFYEHSEEIKAPGVLDKKYSQFAETMICEYLAGFSGLKNKFLFRAVNKLSGYRFYKWYMKRRYRKKDMDLIRNFIECEAHRELVLKGVKNIF